MTKSATINVAYHFLAEAIVIFLFAIPFMNGEYHWVPYWNYLLLVGGVCLLYSIFSIYETRLSAYILSAPVIIFIFYITGYPLIPAVAFPILLTFRYISLRKDTFPKKENMYLNVTIPVAIILLIWIQDAEIVVYAFLLLIVLLMGNILSHLVSVPRKERHDIGKKLWFPLGSFAGILAISTLLLFIFRDIFGKVWYSLMEIPGYIGGKLGMLLGHFFPDPNPPGSLENEDIEKLFGADDTGVKQINETLPAREESSVLEEYVHLIYWGIGILILMVIIILAMRYFRHRFKFEPQQIPHTQVQHSRLDADEMSANQSMFSRFFNTPNNKIRKLIYQFERDAEKADAGRYSYETLDAWMERLGFQIDLAAYKRVRYGGHENVNEEEAQTLKEQLQAVQKDLRKRKSRS